MKISVMGTGYVGLVTGATLAETGNQVTCLDILEAKITELNQGKSPIFEPGLEKLIQEGIRTGNLKGSTDIENGIVESDLTFICVGTPSEKDGSIDLNYIKSAASSIGRALRHKEKKHTVIVKSTVIPLTTEEIVLPILIKKSGWKREQLGVGMNPEFLKEGSAVKDAQEPDRIVIGSADRLSLRVMRSLYKEHKCPKLECNPRTAEFIKYASNSFLAAKISFVNEMANMCNSWGIDFKEVAEGMGMDSRISPLFLRAGAGFGGSCFPKDVKALAAAAKSDNVESKMLEATLEVNELQPQIIVQMAEERLGVLKGKKIAVLGLAFKPDTDDVRESRSEIVVKELMDKGAEVVGHDPEAMDNFKELIEVNTAPSVEEAVEKADCVILMTEWKEYTKINLKMLRNRMSGNVIIDGRRAFNPEQIENAGFDYRAIGLG
jgi:UDPglucose 6-dehydrogenase